MADDIKIIRGSELAIKGHEDEHIHIDLDQIQNPVHIHLDQVQKIAPVAAHIKEVNHIDPISIDEMHISNIGNISPIRVEQFNVTNLPTVNLSVRQLPNVDMNIRRLPPVSVGVNQNFHIPSNYIVRAQFMGIEFLRVNLLGQTAILPKDKHRKEKVKVPNRSYPLPAAVRNPAIPSIHQEKSTVTHIPSTHAHAVMKFGHQHDHTIRNRRSIPPRSEPTSHYHGTMHAMAPSLHPGDTSSMSFHLPAPHYSETHGEASISSGG